MPTDAELLIRSRTDPEAFGTLFDRHANTVHGYLARRLEPGVAEDLVSEVFIRALEARYRTRPHESGSVRPWLLGIARNLVLKHRTRSRPRLRVADPSERVDWQGVDDRLDAQAMTTPLQLALDGLTDIEREVLLLVGWEQLSIGEAADVLGIKPGAARVRLHRARAHAAAALAAVPHPYQTQEN